MLEVQITGDSHPKTFTIVSNDQEAENDRFGALLKEAFGEDDDLAQEWMTKERDSDDHLRLIIPPDAVETVGEMLMHESDWPDEGKKIIDCIEGARDEAMAAMESKDTADNAQDAT
jgi:hypothetical protein